ncbi:MAG: hypothetical protein CMH28_06760 [Micavibrio sp.]|nr:hypothetical protein [Micavibrio sp.]|tara:strand:+ start:314 stop:1192 length:879 start_codon:yes stop_codon:yes gene_type:complete
MEPKSYPEIIDLEGYSSISVRETEQKIESVAAEIIRPRFRNLSDKDIGTKSNPRDFVTVADQESEEALKSFLTDLLPDSLFIGEETYAMDKGCLNAFSEQDTPVWVLDPIDGTSRFVQGKEGFATMLALTHKGKMKAGWIYDIMAKQLYSGFENIGAFIDRDIVPTKGAATPPSGLLGAYYLSKEQRAALKNIPTDLDYDVSFMVSAMYYPLFLNGTLDFAVFFNANVWDQLPGCSILNGQGLVIRNLEGDPYTSSLGCFDKGCIIARNESLYEQVKEEILKPIEPHFSFGK